MANFYHPIHWEDIDDYNGTITDLTFDLEWDDSDEGTRIICSVVVFPNHAYPR